MFDLRFPIIGNTPAEKELKELAEFAYKPENWFDPFGKGMSPKEYFEKTNFGNESAPYVRTITVPTGDTTQESYRVIFSISVAKIGTRQKIENVTVRHLTLGVVGLERHPDALEVFTISRFLGFKSDQLITMSHPEMRAIVVIEPLSEVELQEFQSRTPSPEAGQKEGN